MAARKQKAKSTKEASEVVEGVTLWKVKPGYFNAAYLKALEVQKRSKGKVALPPDGTPLAERVRALVLWNRATTAVDKLSGCSECGGDSSIELDMCPFCGDHEIVDAEGNLVKSGNNAVTEPEDADDEPAPVRTGIHDLDDRHGAELMDEAGNGPPAPSSPPDEPTVVQPPTPKRVKKPRPGASQAPASLAPDGPPHGPVVPTAADPLPPAPKGGRKLRSAGHATIAAAHDALDASMQGSMDRDRDPEDEEDCATCKQPKDHSWHSPGDIRSHAFVSKTSLAIAPPSELVLDAPAAGYTITDLNKSVALITELKRTAADSLWKLGQAVKSVLDNRLWMLRTDANGVPKYRTFKQFVVGELDMSYMQAHRLAQVSEGFTEAEMHQIGVSKCHVMLQVPKDRRAGLLASAEKGATLTQISNEVAKMTANERPKPPPRAALSLTVAMAPGRVELPLFARPKGRHGYASEAEQKANPRPATGITDDPFCIEMLPNDVLVTYNIAKNLDGSWVLIVNRRRAKETELFKTDGEEDTDEEEYEGKAGGD